jgi:hypothetical protein
VEIDGESIGRLFTALGACAEIQSDLHLKNYVIRKKLSRMEFMQIVPQLFVELKQIGPEDLWAEHIFSHRMGTCGPEGKGFYF